MNFTPEINKLDKNIEKIQKDFIPLNAFGKFFVIIFEFLKRLPNIPKYLFICILWVVLINQLYWMILMNFSFFTEWNTNNNTSPFILFFASIGFFAGLCFLVWYFFGIFSKLVFLELKNTYKTVKISISEGLHIEKNRNSVIILALQIPKYISSQNRILWKNLHNSLKNTEKFYEISSNILKTIEKISKYQKILPIFFRRDYINSVNSLILQEIQLLQNILEYSFHHQIQNHNTIISEISNLQNNEWKDFSEILELQKTRLENQKNIFEKILQK